MPDLPAGGAGGTGGAAPGRMPGTSPVGSNTADDATKQAAKTSEQAKLGAGGTSLSNGSDGDAQDGALGGGSSALHAGAGLAAVPAAAVGAQLAVFAAFVNFLKGLAMTLMAIASNLWNLAAGLVLAAAKAALGAVMGVGGMVSGAIGGAVSSLVAGATAFIAGGAVVAVAVTTAVVGTNVQAQNLLRNDVLPTCTTTATAALDQVEGSNGDVDAKTLANAQTVYGVLAAWGMPDENIAGIVGNWDAESGVDPTSVQGYFNSPQAMSDEKREAAHNTDNGIGLGQWTFGRNANLRAYATGHSVDWWTMETQLGFMLSEYEGGNATIVRDMISESLGSPKAAAAHFHDEWERSADTPAMAARRGEKAEKWMGLFAGWETNQALADSILAQSGATVGDANKARTAAIRDSCISAGNAQTVLKEGGLTLEEATALMATFRSEGEQFLQGRYPGESGPGDCGYGKADNCVGFSTYWINKFTSFQKYSMGNGIDTAGSLARNTGKTTTNIPSVYSVGSGPGPYPRGHTLVILGIEGDMAIVGEAACGTNHSGTRAFTRPLAEFTTGEWEFTAMDDLLLDEPMSA